MKLLELYASKDGAHKFIAVEGTRRTELAFTSANNDAMLAQALSIIESDRDFEPRIRIYDVFGRFLKRNETMWVQLERLKSWVQHDTQPVAA